MAVDQGFGGSIEAVLGLYRGILKDSDGGFIEDAFGQPPTWMSRGLTGGRDGFKMTPSSATSSFASG
jgi:hypothetical protein